MKICPMTWGRWLEILVGALPPTVYVTPLLLAAATSRRVPLLWALYGLTLPLLAIVSLWCVILFGPEQVNQRPAFRWFILVTGVAGLLEVFYFAAVILLKSKSLFAGQYGYSPFFCFLLLALVGPLLVGLRYLPKLIKGTK